MQWTYPSHKFHTYLMLRYLVRTFLGRAWHQASVIGSRSSRGPYDNRLMCSALAARCVILGCSSGMVCVGVINGNQRSMRKSKSSVGPLLRANRGICTTNFSRHQPFLLQHTTPRHKPKQLNSSTHTIFRISRTLFRNIHLPVQSKAKMPTMYNVRPAHYLPLGYLC